MGVTSWPCSNDELEGPLRSVNIRGCLQDTGSLHYCGIGSTEHQAEHMGWARRAVTMLHLVHLPSTYSSALPDE